MFQGYYYVSANLQLNTIKIIFAGLIDVSLVNYLTMQDAHDQSLP